MVVDCSLEGLLSGAEYFDAREGARDEVTVAAYSNEPKGGHEIAIGLKIR